MWFVCKLVRATSHPLPLFASFLVALFSNNRGRHIRHLFPRRYRCRRRLSPSFSSSSLPHLSTDARRLMGNGLSGPENVVLLRSYQYMPSSFAKPQGNHLLANSSLPRIPSTTSQPIDVASK
ncbi:hypothetical protein BDN71DRAFT_1446910 [Pleurotus eryngii]|uniref:Uncharacterized protein n=1 Tax=Pleurotus eryngii TaxID=5323 RepID=A0A9P6DH38_PLEER|nr:hypothetical protein BDN71DRAFT_1446910 [Pleurotus eryngii]